MTPHIEAKLGEIAPIVLMPGDPLRAKFIAENFLSDVTQFNGVRGMLGFTGMYNGVKISVMGSGMGIPSMGIYAYELYKFYNVETIVRVGTAGGIADSIKLRDIVIAQAACTDSNFINQFELAGHFAPIADFDLLRKAVETAKKADKNVHVGNVITSDIFYGDCPENKALQNWKKMGILAVEMEAAGLYTIAARMNKKALSILTISDMVFTHEQTSPEERQEGFSDMIKIALETVTKGL